MDGRLPFGRRWRTTMRPAVLLAVLAAVLLPGRGTAAESPDVESLAFLAGHWCGENVEEVWLEPRGGILLGLNRSMGPQGRAAFEYLRIEQRADGVYYVASPGGGPSTPFRLVNASDRRATFENPDHDFPVRILYALQPDGRLKARAEGPDGNGPEWLWSRCPAGS
jgi:surfactin synthase thioesterase subunit